MNKKVAIVTIQSCNYGNRLQNYALQEVLKIFGFQVDTLRRGLPPSSIKKMKIIFKNIIQSLLGTKGAKFRQFDKRIYKSNIYVTANDVPKDLALRYDYFIVGSDQVWNPYFDFVGKADFLTFACPKQKIAYAASFGISDLPKNKFKEYKEYLSEFEKISVREEAGAHILEVLVDKKVPVVLDPTLLLSADNWRKLEKKPKHILYKEYILVYELGEKNIEFQIAIEEMKKKYNVINIRAIKHNGREWEVGPSEFLYLIDHAKMVLTDSFHGVVFCLVFHTEFRIFERMDINMSSRIETLLNLTGIKNYQKNGENYKIDFMYVDKKIEEYQHSSIAFLKEALKNSE